MRKKETLLINSFFYNRQKNVILMHRYQVAKYVIFDKNFSIQGKFYKNKKMKIFKMRL
jgi:hypothetical protein